MLYRLIRSGWLVSWLVLGLVACGASPVVETSSQQVIPDIAGATTTATAIATISSTKQITVEPTATATVQPTTLAMLKAAVADTINIEPVALASEQKLNVVATTNLVADVVAQIGGDLIELTTLMPIAADPHVYQPTPRDLRAIAKADLIFINGANLEQFIDEILTNAGGAAAIIPVSEGIDILEFEQVGENVGSLHRLLIGDRNARTVQLFDLEEETTLATYSIAPSVEFELYRSPTGRYGLVTQPDQNKVTVVDGGAWVEDHGDHLHPYTKMPTLMDFTLENGSPSHTIIHDRKVAIFFEEAGQATVFSERNLRVEDAPLITIPTVAEQGLALPFRDKILVTTAAASTDANPNATEIAVYNVDGELLQQFSGCDSPLSAAANRINVVFGCRDSLLHLTWTDNQFMADNIAYPSPTTPDAFPRTLRAYRAGSILVGDSGEDNLLLIDLEASQMSWLDLPATPLAFDFEPKDQMVAVLTSAGELHQLDPQSGELLNSITVIAPVDLAESSDSPQPNMVVGHGVAYISNPSVGEVLEVELEPLAVTRRLAVGGQPGPLALLGALEKRTYDEEAIAAEEGRYHVHEGPDPHTWFDPNNVVVWTGNIAYALSMADPAQVTTYQSRAQAYATELTALDNWIETQVAQIPPENRQLVTDHETFGYFARQYGFEQRGAVIKSFSTAAEPSAQDIAELQENIIDYDVPAIFVGTTVNPIIAEQVAADTGIKLVRLYTDSLSEPEGDAGTYLDFMRYNVNQLTTALK